MYNKRNGDCQCAADSQSCAQRFTETAAVGRLLLLLVRSPHYHGHLARLAAPPPPLLHTAADPGLGCCLLLCLITCCCCCCCCFAADLYLLWFLIPLLAAAIHVGGCLLPLLLSLSLPGWVLAISCQWQYNAWQRAVQHVIERAAHSLNTGKPMKSKQLLLSLHGHRTSCYRAHRN